MNYTRDTGWYYISLSNRAPAWTGVQPLYRFLTTNKGKGPYARLVSAAEVHLGDLVQLSFNGGETFGHSLFIVDDEINVLNSLTNNINWGKVQCKLVGSALDGITAWTYIKSEPPDIVMTDIIMLSISICPTLTATVNTIIPTNTVCPASPG